MRIVGGKYRGKKLRAPVGPEVRPTADRVRESLFNILVHGRPAEALARGLSGTAVLDLFCGTGAMGLEAMSRGAARGVFVDHDAAALKCAKENAAAMGVWRDCLMLRLDGGRLPPPARATKAPLDMAFLDPPYGHGLAGPALLGLAGRGWLRPGGLAVVEVGAEEDLPVPSGFAVLDDRTIGPARLVFLLRGDK